MPRQRLHLVYNESSGAFERGLLIDDLRDRLTAKGWQIVNETDLEQGNLPGPDSLAAVSADAIAIAGGDGSIKTVLNLLAGQDNAPPALVLPCGTANLLARHIHESLDLDTIIERGLSAQARLLQLGEANGQVFAVAAAVGVSPALVKFREDIRKLGFWRRMRRSMASLQVGFRSMFRGPFLIEVEGEAASRRATAIYVTCPDSPVADGQFLVFGGRMRNVADLLSGLAMAALHTVDRSGRSWSVETRSLLTRSKQPVPVILDGEPHTFDSPVTFNFGGKRVLVIVT